MQSTDLAEYTTHTYMHEISVIPANQYTRRKFKIKKKRCIHIVIVKS